MARGRKTLINENLINTAVKLAAENRTITEICKFLEIARPTYYLWAEKYPELKKLIDDEKQKAKEREIEKVKKSLYRLTQRHKLTTIKECYDGNNKFIGKTVETKEIDPNVNAINSYLERTELEDSKTEETDHTFNIVDESPVRACDTGEFDDE